MAMLMRLDLARRPSSVVLLVLGVLAVVQRADAAPHSVAVGHRATAAPMCASAQLSATFGGQGATQTLLGSVTITNHGRAGCRLSGRPTITMRGGSPHERVEQRAMNTAALFPGEHFSTTILLNPGRSASVRIQWSNWCNPTARTNPTSGAPAEGRRPTQILVTVAANTGAITATVSGGLHAEYLPICIASNRPSRMDVSLWPTKS
jgi:hypothetical protein